MSQEQGKDFFPREQNTPNGHARTCPTEIRKETQKKAHTVPSKTERNPTRKPKPKIDSPTGPVTLVTPTKRHRKPSGRVLVEPTMQNLSRKPQGRRILVSSLVLMKETLAESLHVAQPKVPAHFFVRMERLAASGA